MATHRFSILGPTTSIAGAGGGVYFESWVIAAGTPVHEPLVTVFTNSGVRDPVYGTFMVPEIYVGSPVVLIL